MEIVGYDEDVLKFSSNAYDDWFWYHYKDKIAYEVDDENKEYITLKGKNKIDACIIGGEVCLYLNGEILHSVGTDDMEFGCNRIMELLMELEHLIHKIGVSYKTTIHLSY